MSGIHPDPHKRACEDTWHALIDASRALLAVEDTLDVLRPGCAAHARATSRLHDAERDLRNAAHAYTDATDAAIAATTAPGYARRWARS